MAHDPTEPTFVIYASDNDAAALASLWLVRNADKSEEEKDEAVQRRDAMIMWSKEQRRRVMKARQDLIDNKKVLLP